ncbi:MAG: ParA family protein [Chlorobium sp.]
MMSPVLTFFNTTSGVGKTSLIYHLAWMFASLRKRVVVVDLDTQANLTAAFLDEENIEDLWSGNNSGATIFQCIDPVMGVGDIVEPQLITLATDLYLMPGDVNLSGYEDALSEARHNSMGDKNRSRSMRILSSFWQVIQMASAKVEADLILVDIGPNLGAINRSVLIASDYVVIPLGADLFSLHSLKNLGQTLRSWKELWQKRVENWTESPEIQSAPRFQLPQASMLCIGYLCQQHSVKLDRPVTAHDKWVNRIPDVYREEVLQTTVSSGMKPSDDPYCLATIKHYRSLIPMAQERRKPIFKLTSADGAIGSHANAVQDAKKDFRKLAEKIAGLVDRGNLQRNRRRSSHCC